VVTDGAQLCGIVTQSDIFLAVRNKLRAEEQRNLDSLQRSNNNVYTTDLDGIITYVNPALMKLLEVSDPDELIGRPFLPERFGLDSQEREMFVRELEKGSIESRQLALKTFRGNRVYVTLFPSVTRNFRGAINGSQGIIYDVTAKKELVALRQAEEELERTNQDLKTAVQELKRANKELREFAHVAAHDLKTPLRAIGTLAEWLSTDYADKFDERGAEQVRLLVGKARQMGALVDDILQYSRLGQDGRRRQTIDVNAIVSELITEIAPPDNIEIVVLNDLPVVMCEQTQILQIFQNLLANAIKYMDKLDGRIEISCVDDQDCWKFSVADNGPGIDRRYFEKIFKMFQTLSPREDSQSTGIGLAIVRKIAELNGGRAWVESELGKGSTFYFTLQKQQSEQMAYSG
jgi:PAS domain S-box-containing protein